MKPRLIESEPACIDHFSSVYCAFGGWDVLRAWLHCVCLPFVSELPKTYDPVGTEARWQQAWEDQGAFHPDPKAPGDPFSVVIPPPNVTGSLHMGHAFNTALIDTIVG